MLHICNKLKMTTKVKNWEIRINFQKVAISIYCYQKIRIFALPREVYLKYPYITIVDLTHKELMYFIHVCLDGVIEKKKHFKYKFPFNNDFMNSELNLCKVQRF